MDWVQTLPSFLTKMFGKKNKFGEKSKCLPSSFWLGLTMVASAGEEDNTIFFSSLFFSCKKQNSNTVVRNTKIQAITKVKRKTQYFSPPSSPGILFSKQTKYKYKTKIYLLSSLMYSTPSKLKALDFLYFVQCTFPWLA